MMAFPPLPAVKRLQMMDTFIKHGAAPLGGRQEGIGKAEYWKEKEHKWRWTAAFSDHSYFGW